MLPSSWEVIQTQELGSSVRTLVETRPALNRNYVPASSALANISNRLYELKLPSRSLYKKCLYQLGDKGFNSFETDVHSFTKQMYEFCADCSEGGRSLITAAKFIAVCPGILSGL